ncbi:uncharacterized protein LOC132919427 [Rhopalosiphum padi]|uniref:uncharacterized protein LOC132919427 n=1 Tax=Rhopalosiphum padi TaxID=40932 RepID=UPI00298D81B2|nr:uncharacterized protein LOC132919427 [Rhopalosiphum padi]
MANVIAWNCNFLDPTSYNWNDKATTDDLTDGCRTIDHTSATTCSDEFMFISKTKKSSVATVITPDSSQITHSKFKSTVDNDDTSAEICSEEIVGGSTTSTVSGHNVKSTQHPSITLSEHNDNNSMTTKCSIVEQNIRPYKSAGYDGSSSMMVARKTKCLNCSNVMTLYTDYKYVRCRVCQ